MDAVDGESNETIIKGVPFKKEIQKISRLLDLKILNTLYKII